MSCCILCLHQSPNVGHTAVLMAGLPRFPLSGTAKLHIQAACAAAGHSAIRRTTCYQLVVATTKPSLQHSSSQAQPSGSLLPVSSSQSKEQQHVRAAAAVTDNQQATAATHDALWRQQQRHQTSTQTCSDSTAAACAAASQCAVRPKQQFTPSRNHPQLQDTFVHAHSRVASSVHKQVHKHVHACRSCGSKQQPEAAAHTLLGSSKSSNSNQSQGDACTSARLRCYQ